MVYRASGTPKLVGGVTLTPALIQWLVDCQVYELQPIPLRSMAGSPRPQVALRDLQVPLDAVHQPGPATQMH